MFIAMIPALSGAVSCDDKFEQGKIDLTMPEKEDTFKYPETYTFNHPCAYVSSSDIERVKTKIQAADPNDPVYASWTNFCKTEFSQKTYKHSPLETLVRGDATGTGTNENFITACRDAAAAFQLALRYHISGDASYADAAVVILNDWAKVCKRITANDNNQYLLAGFQGYQFANAAELLRGYTGWEAADQNKFKQWLLDVWYAKNSWFIEEHGGDGVCSLHYWPNWELCNLASMLAIGIYTENVEIVNTVYRNFREGYGSGCINNMIPYDPIPDPEGKTALIAQNMESGRDQGHATLVVSMCAELCQMAYNIGIDFWGMENDKVLAMCEYTAKYNMSGGSPVMPFTEFKYCTGCSCKNQSHGSVHTQISADGRGTVRACWDMIYNHYSKVKGYGPDKVYYSRKFAEQLRYTNGVLTGDGGAGDSRYGSNSSAFDQIGWGTMLFYR